VFIMSLVHEHDPSFSSITPSLGFGNSIGLVLRHGTSE
jgi:hypothetical protein